MPVKQINLIHKFRHSFVSIYMPTTQINLILEYWSSTKLKQQPLFRTVPTQDGKKLLLPLKKGKLLLPLKKGNYCWTTNQHYLGKRGPIIQSSALICLVKAHTFHSYN